MRTLLHSLAFALGLSALPSCKHKDDAGTQASLASLGSDTADAVVPASFLTAYREYLGFYQASTYPVLAASHPDIKQVLFGSRSGPYDLQASQLEDLIKRPNFSAMPDPAANIECTPTFIRALSTYNGQKVTYRGTVVMVHGFSACPQQFYDLALKLSQLGYHAFIPVMPGQGRGPAPAGAEKGQAPTGIADMAEYYTTYMPNYVEEDRYTNFASYINSIVANLPGEKFAMGLSGGAAVAHNIAIEKPGMYKRALLLSTYYHQRDRSIPDPVYDSSQPPTDPQFLGLVNTARNWGQYCYDNTLLGRRGICDARFSVIIGLNRYAAKLISFIKSEAPKRTVWPQIQYVTVENDGGSDTLLTADVYQIQRQAKPRSMAMCFYRGVPHPFLSKYDQPGANLYWMPSFFEQTIAFVRDGRFFREDAASLEAKPGAPYKTCYIPASDLPAKG